MKKALLLSGLLAAGVYVAKAVTPSGDVTSKIAK